MTLPDIIERLILIGDSVGNTIHDVAENGGQASPDQNHALRYDQQEIIRLVEAANKISPEREARG